MGEMEGIGKERGENRERRDGKVENIRSLEEVRLNPTYMY